jgi:hypothetical protein
MHERRNGYDRGCAVVVSIRLLFSDGPMRVAPADHEDELHNEVIRAATGHTARA